MNEENSKAFAYAERLLSVAIDVVGAAQVQIDGNWARNPKIIGLTLLCRSISNFRAALILVRENNVLEAHILNRCLYENELWIAALRERGVEFIEKMRSDEAHARRSLAQLTLEISGRHGADVDNEGSMFCAAFSMIYPSTFPSPRNYMPTRPRKQPLLS